MRTIGSLSQMACISRSGAIGLDLHQASWSGATLGLTLQFKGSPRIMLEPSFRDPSNRHLADSGPLYVCARVGMEEAASAALSWSLGMTRKAAKTKAPTPTLGYMRCR